MLQHGFALPLDVVAVAKRAVVFRDLPKERAAPALLCARRAAFGSGRSLRDAARRTRSTTSESSSPRFSWFCSCWKFETSLLVERHDLAVENRILDRQRFQRLGDGSEAGRPIVAVAADQADFAVLDKRDGAVAVELELVQPSSPSGTRLASVASCGLNLVGCLARRAPEQLRQFFAVIGEWLRSAVFF